MANDDLTKFSLDLDNAGFLSAAKQAQSAMDTLGNADNLKGLISAFDSALPLLGAMGVAILAIKASMDEVFSGEQIAAVNEQFEILTRNAGLSADAIRDGMKGAAGGLIDETRLTELSNEAIVRLGTSAGQLPAIMEMARKASVVMGTDLQTTFDKLTMAIQSGNQRLLMRAGLNVDVAKAEKQYADSIGVSVEALSKQGKEQAVLQAVLEAGRTTYAGINADVKQATNAWQQFKVAVTEIKDVFALVFEKTMGPQLRDTFQSMTDTIHSWTSTFKIAMGDNQQQADGLTSRISELQAELLRISKGDLSWSEKLFTNVPNRIDYLNNSITTLQGKLDKLKSTGVVPTGQRTPGAVVEGEVSAPAGMSPVDAEKAKEEEAKFQKEILSLREQALKERQALVMTEADALNVMRDQQKMEEERFETEVEQIKAKKELTTIQRNQLLEVSEQTHQLKMKQLVLDAENEKFRLVQQGYDNQAKASDKFFTKFTAGVHKATEQAKKDFMDFEKLGETMTNKLGNATAQAFAEMGQGSADLGTAMKKAILNALADEAQARGAVLIASSIFPPNPLGLAAGAGLATLAGVLRAAAGGGASSSISTPSTAAGGGVIGAGTPVASVSTAPDTGALAVQTAQTGQSVSIQIMGSVFDSQETATRIADLVRQSADAQSFKVSSIGGGF